MQWATRLGRRRGRAARWLQPAETQYTNCNRRDASRLVNDRSRTATGSPSSEIPSWATAHLMTFAWQRAIVLPLLMQNILYAVVGSLLASGIFAVTRFILKRHRLLMALSREVEWLREQLKKFQIVLREAQARSYQRPVVFRFKPYERNRFSALLHSALQHAPTVHESLAIFDQAFNAIESEFEGFVDTLALNPRDGSDDGLTAVELAALARRIFVACEIVLQETSNRELVAFPRIYRVNQIQSRFDEVAQSSERFHHPVRLLPRPTHPE